MSENDIEENEIIEDENIEPSNELNTDIVNDERCTCNDEFKTNICPVHNKDKNPLTGTYNVTNTIVTDENLMKRQLRLFSGYPFKCPRCGTPILHFMKFCPECGLGVNIQSRYVTSLINELTGK